LQNAAAIAGLLLTIECLVTEIPQKEKPGSPPGGMGGMADGWHGLLSPFAGSGGIPKHERGWKTPISFASEGGVGNTTWSLKKRERAKYRVSVQDQVHMASR
jgi:hypothetical protein